MSYIIKVENLGKKYRVQHQGERERYVALRDVIASKATAPLRWLRNQTSAFRSQTSASNNDNGTNPHFAPGVGSSLPAPSSVLPANGSSPLPLTASHSGPSSSRLTPDASRLTPSSEDFWALRDVNFEVKQGEVVGIIGRNGAGKSTLLKILSRITEPTEGRVRLRGRVASLLEVGTGFHPELTGRENIFVNGAILGMSRREVRRKFDEIVAFAEVEKFLDTPVKRYSSGMYVRLAFAVAAHLEPEILVVDEVLAVGDAQFQSKCLGKLDEVSKGGRTVLLVTHQMNQVRRLCEQCVWLEAGKVQKIGKTVEIISAYESVSNSVLAERFSDHRNNNHSAAQFLKWEIIDNCDEQPNVLTSIGRVQVRFVLRVDRRMLNGHHGVTLYNSDNQLMWATAVDHLILVFDFSLGTQPISRKGTSDSGGAKRRSALEYLFTLSLASFSNRVFSPRVFLDRIYLLSK